MKIFRPLFKFKYQFFELFQNFLLFLFFFFSFFYVCMCETKLLQWDPFFIIFCFNYKKKNIFSKFHSVTFRKSLAALYVSSDKFNRNGSIFSLLLCPFSNTWFINRPFVTFAPPHRMRNPSCQETSSSIWWWHVHAL